MSEITLILTIISTFVTTLFAIVQLYLKIKQALKDAEKEIINSKQICYIHYIMYMSLIIDM